MKKNIYQMKIMWYEKENIIMIIVDLEIMLKNSFENQNFNGTLYV